MRKINEGKGDSMKNTEKRKALPELLRCAVVAATIIAGFLVYAAIFGFREALRPFGIVI
ncbi:hypothetical protein [Burkholderia glumae]